MRILTVLYVAVGLLISSRSMAQVPDTFRASICSFQDEIGLIPFAYSLLPGGNVSVVVPEGATAIQSNDLVTILIDGDVVQLRDGSAHILSAGLLYTGECINSLPVLSSLLSLAAEHVTASKRIAAMQAQLVDAMANERRMEVRLAQALLSQEDARADALTALSQNQALTAENVRQRELLDQPIAEMRNQVGTLQTLLNISAESDADAQVQIEALGSQLNTALARVAAEERRRRILEEAERARLQAEADGRGAEP